MTAETKAEEFENKEVLPQEEDEDEEEEDPGVTPGAGEYLSPYICHFSSHCGFHEQTVRRKRRKRRSPRRRRQLSLILQGSDFRNFSQAEYIRPERSASIQTSEDPDLPHI